MARSTLRWRTGRKLGRTIYIMAGDEPSDDDVFVGIMDSPGLAKAAVHAYNTAGEWQSDL